MPEITIHDLAPVLAECAGVLDQGPVGGDILDVSFDDLGFDSVARLELLSASQRAFGVALPDDSLAAMQNPREFLTLINRWKAEGSAAKPGFDDVASATADK